MPGHEWIGDEERSAVLDIFDRSNGVLFAHGFDEKREGRFRVRDFEKEFGSRLSFAHCQAVSSGTAALKVALESIGVGPGDEVITQAHTYIATLEAIISLGAIPVVAEVDESLNMCPEDLQSLITKNTKAVVPVHMLGEMCDMTKIMDVCESHGLVVVEDCAQGLGSSHRGVKAGGYGAVAAFSTDGGKTICTGEGGIVATDSREIFEVARSLHDHGHAYSDRNRAIDPGVRPGFNFRMSELQAAVGVAQLSKFEDLIATQRSNKELLLALTESFGIRVRPNVDPTGDSGDSIVWLLESPEQARMLVSKLAEAGVGTKNLPGALRWHFAGHWDFLFSSLVSSRSFPTEWPKSRDLLERSVAIGISLLWSEEQIHSLSNTISSAVKASH